MLIGQYLEGESHMKEKDNVYESAGEAVKVEYVQVMAQRCDEDQRLCYKLCVIDIGATLFPKFFFFVDIHKMNAILNYRLH